MHHIQQMTYNCQLLFSTYYIVNRKSEIAEENIQQPLKDHNLQSSRITNENKVMAKLVSKMEVWKSRYKTNASLPTTTIP